MLKCLGGDIPGSIIDECGLWIVFVNDNAWVLYIAIRYVNKGVGKSGFIHCCKANPRIVRSLNIVVVGSSEKTVWRSVKSPG